MAKKIDYKNIAISALKIVGGKKNLIYWKVYDNVFVIKLRYNHEFHKKLFMKLGLANSIVKDSTEWWVTLKDKFIEKFILEFKELMSSNEIVERTQKIDLEDLQQNKKNEDLSLLEKTTSSFKKGNQNGLWRFFLNFVDIFIPLIPLLILSGVSLIIQYFLTKFGSGVMLANISHIFAMIYFYMTRYCMIMVIGYTSMKKFGGTPIFGLIVTSIFVIHSLMIHGFEINFNDLNSTPAPFTFDISKLTVVPGVSFIILLTLFISMIERIIRLIMPDYIAVIFSPITIIMLGFVLGLFIMTPITGYIYHWLFKGLLFLTNMNLNPYVKGVVGFGLGALYPLFIFLGFNMPIEHQLMFHPSENSMSSFYQVIPSITYLSISAIAFVVAIKKRKSSNNTKEILLSLLSFFGIGKPGSFQMQNRHFYVFPTIIFSSAVGGYWLSLTDASIGNQVFSLSNDSPKGISYLYGVFSIIDCQWKPTPIINTWYDNIPKMGNILIALSLTFITAFSVSLIHERFVFKTIVINKTIKTKKSYLDNNIIDLKMHKKFSLKTPLAGLVKKASESTHTLYNSKQLGEGVVIIPSVGELRSPCNGVISRRSTLGGQYEIELQDSTKILIQIGVQTQDVEFDSSIDVGEKVKKGQTLSSFSLEELKAKSQSIESLIVVTNDTLNKRFLKLVCEKKEKYIKFNNNLMNIKATPKKDLL